MIKLAEFATVAEFFGDKKELREISNKIRVRVPRYWMSPAYKLFQRTQGKLGWDGYEYPLAYKREHWLAKRGHIEAIIEAAQKLGIEIDASTRRPSPFVGLTIDDLPGNLLPGAPFDPDLLQQECIVELLRHATGSIRAVVSSGKTMIFWSVAAMVKRLFPNSRVLYVTPTERLVNQVFKEGKKFLPDWSISQFGGGKRDFSGTDAVVCTAAAVWANFDELKASGWFKTFYVLLFDEAHHLGGAESWIKLGEATPAFFRFGASDSLKDEREDDRCAWMKIRGLTGPRRATIDSHPLIEVGRVATPWLYLIDPPGWQGKFDGLSHQAEPMTQAWTLHEHAWVKATYLGPATMTSPSGQEVQKLGYHQVQFTDGREVQVESRLTLLKRTYDEAVIRNKDRNGLVVDWVKHFVGKGYPTLVVATRTPHILILDGLLKRAGLEVEILTSDHSSKERDEVFAWLTAGPSRVLVSGIVKEGVSIPELKAGVVADVVVSVDLARQIIGRFIRKKPDGDNHAHVAWFIDRTYPSARRGCLKLFDELQTLKGYNFRYPCVGPDQTGNLYRAADLS